MQKDTCYGWVSTFSNMRPKTTSNGQFSCPAYVDNINPCWGNKRHTTIRSSLSCIDLANPSFVLMNSSSPRSVHSISLALSTTAFEKSRWCWRPIGRWRKCACWRWYWGSVGRSRSWRCWDVIIGWVFRSHTSHGRAAQYWGYLSLQLLCSLQVGQNGEADRVVFAMIKKAVEGIASTGGIGRFSFPWVSIPFSFSFPFTFPFSIPFNRTIEQMVFCCPGMPRRYRIMIWTM